MDRTHPDSADWHSETRFGPPSIWPVGKAVTIIWRQNAISTTEWQNYKLIGVVVSVDLPAWKRRSE